MTTLSNKADESIDDLFGLFNSNDVFYNRQQPALVSNSTMDRKDCAELGSDVELADDLPHSTAQSFLGAASFRNWLFGKTSNPIATLDAHNPSNKLSYVEALNSSNPVDCGSRRTIASIFTRNNTHYEETPDVHETKQKGKYWKILHRTFSRERLGLDKNANRPANCDSVSASKNIERLTLQLSDLSSTAVKDCTETSYDEKFISDSSSSSIERAVTIRKNLNEILFPASPISNISHSYNGNKDNFTEENSLKDDVLAVGSEFPDSENSVLNIKNPSSSKSLNGSSILNIDESSASKYDTVQIPNNTKINNQLITNQKCQDSIENKNALELIFPSVFKAAITLSNSQENLDNNSHKITSNSVDRSDENLFNNDPNDTEDSNESPSVPIVEAGPYKYIFPSPPFPTNTNENIDTLLIDERSILSQVVFQCYEELNLKQYYSMINNCSLKEVIEKILYGIISIKKDVHIRHELNKEVGINQGRNLMDKNSCDSFNSKTSFNDGDDNSKDQPPDQDTDTFYRLSYVLRNNQTKLYNNYLVMERENCNLKMKLNILNKKYKKLLKSRRQFYDDNKDKINGSQFKFENDKTIYNSLRKYRFISIKISSLFQKYLENLAIQFKFEQQESFNKFLGYLITEMKTNNLKSIEEKALQKTLHEILHFVSDLLDINALQATEFQRNKIAMNFVMYELKYLRQLNNQAQS
ncbi:hypothetical protein RNJ44_03448 [Nakaseomyces bracarensis]|uniref:Uncharacterized protein n=1 Tax=Nakaseomyces bracarensis TaxID=273131 RepID=A0ABR4NXC0_9SACH